MKEENRRAVYFADTKVFVKRIIEILELHQRIMKTMTILEFRQNK